MTAPWWLMIVLVALIAGFGLGYSACEAVGRVDWATPTAERAAPLPRWVQDAVRETRLLRGLLAHCQEELRQARSERR